MRVQPFSFLEQKDIVTPSAGFPLTTQAIHRYEEVYTNQFSSTLITDLVTGNNNLGLFGGVSINSNQYLDITGNTSSAGSARNSYLQVTINNSISGNRDAYSFIVLEEYQDNTVYTSGNNYFADFRSLSSWFASYMTDKDSLQDAGKFGGGDMFVYVPGQTLFTGTTSSSNFSDGTGNIGGGDDYYQWVGNNPRSRGATGFRRLWGFNIPAGNVFNTSTNGGTYKLFGSSNGQEGTNVKVWAHCLFDTHLTTTTFNQLITYYQGLGYL